VASVAPLDRFAALVVAALAFAAELDAVGWAALAVLAGALPDYFELLGVLARSP
jgi:hypothetical protein